MDRLFSPVVDLQRQYEWLQKEYEYEKDLYRQQVQQSGIFRRIREGVCWYPVRLGVKRYNSLNQLTIEVFRTGEEEIEHHFEHGRPLCFFRVMTDGSLYYFRLSSVVAYVQDDRMVAVVPDNKSLEELYTGSEIGVQLFFDDTSYKVMFGALREVMSGRNERTVYLREVILGNLPAGRREIPPLHFSYLNTSQERAVNEVLAAREVAVVHGPPGTGKTTTLVEAIYETLHRENQVMVCAQSNTAVDWISEKLVDRGIPVLRIGHPTRVNDKMLSFTYERRFEAHPDYPELWKIRKMIREILARRRGGAKRGDREKWQNDLSRLRSRATELEIRIDAQLFAEARVIACTLVGSANRVLERKRFSSLFIDEAAQAMEAACWIAITKAERVILAGDHCQLPPTIKCPEAARNGLDITLLQKVVKQKPEVVSLLNIQYRMHEDIMNFSSAWFYRHALKAAPEVRNRGILEYDSAICWVDTTDANFTEKTVGEGYGRLNTGEAEKLLELLRAYIEKIGINRILEEKIDFGIISPYRAQVQYLRQMIRNDRFFKPVRSLITVHTVDGFQGQERDVIFISLVRSNEKGQIGFLTDLRRMNVAITRARMKLCIIGEVATLARHPFYKALFDYIQALSPASEQ